MTSVAPDAARFRLLAENIGDVLWLKDLDPSHYSYVSPAFERIWGYQTSELSRHPNLWENGIHPDDLPSVHEALRQWFNGEKTDYNVHYRVIHRQGEIRWIADRGIILGRKNGKPYQIGGIARDITEREMAEASRRWLATVVENSDDAIITLNLDGVIQTWNAGAERIFQYSAPEAIGRNVSFLRPQEAADDEIVFRRMIRQGKRIEHYETRRLRKDGCIIDISLSISPLIDSAGRIAGYSKISRDITQRNLDRRMFSRLLEAAPDGFVILDSKGIVRMANARTEMLFGLSKKKIIGSPFESLLPPQEKKRFRASRREFLRQPNHAEKFRGMHLDGLRKGGGIFPMEISLSQVEASEGPLIIIDITDITERKEAEQTIRRLNAELEERVQQRTTELMQQIVTRMQLEEELLQISERERRRIGQDLHDDLGQQLAGAWMMADVLQRRLEAGQSPEPKSAERLCELLKKALNHTRHLARGLHPVAPEQGGLAKALETLAAQSSALFNIKCRFKCVEAIALTDETVMTHLYRIAQEAVSNAVRHGQASNILISLDRNLLCIRDDGRWKQPSETNAGLGLRIMRYRAELNGGSLSIQKNSKRGTTVTCQFVVPSAPPTTRPRKVRRPITCDEPTPSDSHAQDKKPCSNKSRTPKNPRTHRR